MFQNMKVLRGAIKKILHVPCIANFEMRNVHWYGKNSFNLVSFVLNSNLMFIVTTLHWK